MAYTSTPEYSTHQRKFLPVWGGETIASNVMLGVAETSNPTYQGLRYINCYPKRLELTNTDDQWVLTKAPVAVQETKTFSGSGTDPIGCVSSDGVYIWKGRRLYVNDATPGLLYTATDDLVVKTMFQVTNLSGSGTLYAGMLRNKTTGTMHSYTWLTTTSTFTLSAAIPFAEASETAPWQSVFFNSRLYTIGSDQRIYNTPPGNYLSWASTDYIVPEMRADTIVAILLYRNYLCAFSTQSIEFFQDAALELGSPLQRQEAYASLYGVKDAINIAQTGDNIYFLSYEDRYGYGLYNLDNFIPKRISNFYVDTLLNNEDVSSDTPFSTRLHIADMFGDPCVIFNMGFASAIYFESGYVDVGYVFQGQQAQGFPYIVYSTKQKLWFEYQFSNENDYDWTISVQTPGMMQLCSSSLLGQWKTYFVHSYNSNGEVSWYYLTKDYAPGQGSIAEMVYDIENFGTSLWKHIKSVDAIGDFGLNTVFLSWTDRADYSNYSTPVPRLQSAIGAQNVLRWHNLGRHRQTAYRLRFSGTSNIKFNGLEVSYNLGNV